VNEFNGFIKFAGYCIVNVFKELKCIYSEKVILQQKPYRHNVSMSTIKSPTQYFSDVKNNSFSYNLTCCWRNSKTNYKYD